MWPHVDLTMYCNSLLILYPIERAEVKYDSISSRSDTSWMKSHPACVRRGGICCISVYVRRGWPQCDLAEEHFQMTNCPPTQ